MSDKRAPAPPAGFDATAILTKNLLAVPKKEPDAQVASYERRPYARHKSRARRKRAA
ncbi:MAG: hypothetical protein HYU41_18335 [Candidatus Rokubacteria bacterium]|nr:hypothetical protein [Candidatus Rokubacteria bacterium]